MGTKRVGLARIEALIENLKRDLDLSSATITSATISKCVSLSAAKISYPAAVAGVAMTALSATELAANTFYNNGTSTALAMTLPSAAAGNIGDFITVYYGTKINNSTNHTYTTTTDTAFALGSTITRIGGAVTSKADVAVAADNVITIAGTPQGDGGPGTMLRFVNMTGATNGWSAEVVILNNGDGSDASASAFS